MAGDVGKVFVSDGDSSVELHPPQPYPGGSGFHHQVNLRARPFQGAIDASSYASVPVLRTFHKQLVTLYNTLEGEARLPESYENLQIKMKGDGRGHIAVEVVARGENLRDYLAFDFMIVQTQLPAIIAGIEKFLVQRIGGTDGTTGS